LGLAGSACITRPRRSIWNGTAAASFIVCSSSLKVGPAQRPFALALALPHPLAPPAQAPWRLALIVVLQVAENLTDRQAAEAVRSRLDWKYLLGLELTDQGFDHTVLSEVRSRVVAGSADERLLDALLVPPVCVGEATQHAWNTLAVVAPTRLPAQGPAQWVDRFGPRLES
jgi:transposase